MDYVAVHWIPPYWRGMPAWTIWTLSTDWSCVFKLKLHLHGFVVDLLYSLLYNKSTTNLSSGVWVLVRHRGTDYNVIFWLNIVIVGLKSKLQYKRSVINKLHITLRPDCKHSCESRLIFDRVVIYRSCIVRKRHNIPPMQLYSPEHWWTTLTLGNGYCYRWRSPRSLQ